MLLAASLLVIGAHASPQTESWTIVRDCPDCPELVVIPSGDFLMGAEGGEEGRPEGPVHSVSVPAFALARHETTVALFASFVKDTGYQTPGDCRSWDAGQRTVDYRAGSGWENPDLSGLPNAAMPVSCVSWLDAKAFAGWLSDKTGKAYRLPTEAEWEYAALAGSGSSFAWTGDANAGCAEANLYDVTGVLPSIPWESVSCVDGFAEAAPVGSFRANAFGVYDMTGNVWEWVEDCYIAPYPSDTPTDGSAYQVEGQCPRRSVRGGSWITGVFRTRPAWRGRDPEDFRTWIFGFRVARDLTPDESTAFHHTQPTSGATK